MISKKDVEHIAKLSRIELNEKEIEKFQKDLSAILDYFEMLKEIDTKNVKPTFHSLESYFKENVARDDLAKPDKNSQKLISLSPDKKENYIKVKSVFK